MTYELLWETMTWISAHHKEREGTESERDMFLRLLR